MLMLLADIVMGPGNGGGLGDLPQQAQTAVRYGPTVIALSAAAAGATLAVIRAWWESRKKR